MSFTEFCCKSGGSNLNAGTRTGNSTEPGTSASFTYASGSWVSSTGVFTVASGNPSTDGVAVGDFASVYADGASVTTLVGRVTAVSSTTITVSTTVKAGSTTDGTSNRTLKIGGAWKGPNAADTFPFTVATLGSLTNSAGDTTRINLKNDQTYAMTALITDSNTGPRQIEGYSSTYGDHSKATISWSSGSFNHTLSISGAGATYKDVILDTTGKSTVGENFNASATVQFIRCVSKNSPRGGFVVPSGSLAVECEAYGGVGVANLNAFRNSGVCVRCIAHDNTANGGFACIAGGSGCVDCIADSNTGIGFELSNTMAFLVRCDAYNNSSDGVRISNTSNGVFWLDSCNLTKNGGYGINGSGSAGRTGCIAQCGFGAGTEANASGTTTGLKGVPEVGSVTYASNASPFVDAANGDFRISLAAAKGTGRGVFTQTAASYSGTVGYPDIGAAQASSSGSSRPSIPFLQQVIG